ncbi:MAG: hypothetical protein FWD52_03115 [Candidatus Bathyarchaeota archaeon]|nr:hypothetical protein [Candidatus Termiticorpusculum sp.]
MSSTTEKDKEKNASYLTETILSIHNEIQSSLDYISTKATEKGTEFGKSTAIMSIQNLRIKIPVKFNLETGQKEHTENNQQQPQYTSNDDEDQQYKIKGTINNSSSTANKKLEKSLTERTGLILEQDELENRFTYSKIKVALNPNENLTPTNPQQKNTNTTSSSTTTADTSKEAWGEIEITFSPIKRQ